MTKHRWREFSAAHDSRTKDMMIFKKTTYRYEDGKKFAMFTQNDEQ